MRNYILFLLFLSVSVWAQYSPPPGGTGSGNVTATTGAGAPSGACTAGQSFYLNTTPSPRELWFCDTSGTWQKILSTLNTAAFVDKGAKGTAPASPGAGNGLIYFSTVDNALHYLDGDTSVDTPIGGPRDTSQLYWRENWTNNSAAASTWNVFAQGSNSGGFSSAAQSPDLNHASTIRFSTGAVANNDGFLIISVTANGANGLPLPGLGTVSGTQAWEMIGIIRISALANVTWKMCLVGNISDTNASPADGFCVRYVNGTDTTFRLFTCATSVCTNVDSTVTVTAGTWYRFRIYSTASGTIKLDAQPGGGSVTTVQSTTNITAVNLTPALSLRTQGAASVNFDVAAPTIFDITGLTKP